MGNGKCWQHLFFGKLLLKRHRVCVCLYFNDKLYFPCSFILYFKLFTYANHFLSVIMLCVLEFNWRSVYEQRRQQQQHFFI